MNGINTSYVVLAKRLWDEAANKQELKQRIGDYMAVSYPDYKVIKIGKYYAVCERSEPDELPGFFKRKRDEDTTDWD